MTTTDTDTHPRCNDWVAVDCEICLDRWIESLNPDEEELEALQVAAEEDRGEDLVADLEGTALDLEFLADQAWDAAAEAALEAADARAQVRATGPSGWALAGIIMQASQAETWAQARLEWDVIEREDIGADSEMCVCGHEGIRYLHTVENRVTDEVLYPVGSTCVEKFDSEDMLVRSRELKAVREIEKAVNKGTLSHQSFSKRGIDGLWREGIVTGLDAALLHRGFLEWSRKTLQPYTAQAVARIVSEEIIPALTRRTEVDTEGGTR